MNHPGLEAGRQFISVDAANLAPGMYFCRIQTESSTEIKKVILGR